MKKYISIMGLALAVLLSACDPDYDVADYFDLQELPGYVAFDTEGNNASLDDIETDEDAGTVEVVVENPTGTTSDITVNYSLGGSAEFGTDYSIDGATSAGGSLTIPSKGGTVTETIRASIVIDILADQTADGTKEIEITLTDASNAEGSVAVGRGGTDFLKTAKVIIADVD